MNSLFIHSSMKELQHFRFFLERAKSKNMDLADLLKYTSGHINKSIADINVRETTVPEKPEPRPRIIGGHGKPCPGCGSKMKLAVHIDLDDSEVVVAKCKPCQISFIVESMDG